MLESPSSSFAPIEHQEKLSFGEILNNFNIRQNKIQKVQQEEQQHRIIEKKELIKYDEFLYGQRDFDDFNIKLSGTEQDDKQSNQYEVKQTIQENLEKEKLLTF